MHWIWQTFIEAIFPSRSLEGIEGEWMTESELRFMRRSPLIFEGPKLQQKGVVSIGRLIAAADYQSSPLLRSAVHRLKYNGVRALAEPLAQLLVGPATRLAVPEDAVLCPVPLHWTREFMRGFNQARLIADALSGRQDGPRCRSSSAAERPARRQSVSVRAAGKRCAEYLCFKEQ